MSESSIRAWAAQGPGTPLESFSYDPGPLGTDEVEIAVEHCGICHSDWSILQNAWGITQYPVVPGHEVVGRIVAVGKHVTHLTIGQRVGVGWNAGSCMHCSQCLTGNHNLCAEAQPTIVGHHGGFAERVRAHKLWAIALPDTLEMASAGPLLCGGITVFAPLAIYDIKPTAHVGVVGIGGLGHMALLFAKAWGCEVTALTSHPDKTAEAKRLGAHNVLPSNDSAALANATHTLDLLIVTVNVPLDWSAMMQLLKPNGRMHVVGAVLEPIGINAFDLIMGQRSVSGSPTGGPDLMATMLQFAARHAIAPQVEHFPMRRVNEALAHLVAGKPRYRIVLDADF